MARIMGKITAPLQLPIMFVAPKRKLTYYSVYADDLETFDTIRRTLEADSVLLKLLYAYLDPDCNQFFATLVLDSTEAKIGEAQIVEKINRLQKVEVTNIGRTGDGLAVSESHSLQVVGTPVAVFGRDVIGSTCRFLVEALGDRVDELLFRAGEEVGRQRAGAVPKLLNKLGVALSPELLRERFYDLQVFGWAKVASLSVDDQFAGEALLSDDFEAAAWQGKAGTTKCNWIRGFLTGLLSVAGAKPFEVIETECQAKGDKHCRFTFRPSSN